MRSVISQSITLPVPAQTLFEMYLDPVQHQAITGSPVIIGKEAGAEFRAFDGVLSGTILAVNSPNLIVQSWRSTAFKPADPDSTLILNFIDDEAFGKIDLVHLDVPEHDYDGVTQGWEKFYWTPWREYLESRAQ
ncbi:SRPBCC domain-containing protein [Thalassomonas sp. RHCl1]|uniref:SRPBCC domain-containing protein n=1 Tax=Thalassomonas sp. RHCl1 TaxID=2995320 RepID=UPI00248AD285|nr:SRPBCC domain-containing protein [Thalassomonas sp. RHCl1]